MGYRHVASAEVGMAVELAYLYEDAVRKATTTQWAEVRQWLDRLGLNLKGKRDLRVRVAGADETRPAPIDVSSRERYAEEYKAHLRAADAEDYKAHLRAADAEND